MDDEGAIRLRPDRFRFLREISFEPAFRRFDSDYPPQRDFPYEWDLDKPAIGVVDGGPALSKWGAER